MITNEMMNYNYDNPNKEVQDNIIGRHVDAFISRERSEEQIEFMEAYVMGFVQDQSKIIDFNNYRENLNLNIGKKIA